MAEILREVCGSYKLIHYRTEYDLVFDFDLIIDKNPVKKSKLGVKRSSERNMQFIGSNIFWFFPQ